MNRDTYADIALSLIPRILSSLDRNKSSNSFGCFDKNYWFYKVVDFPCARFQEPVLTLALLYKNKFNKNIYFKKEKIREWSVAGMRFLSEIQNSDGSFNEWYPNEHSFCATVFSTYSSTEAYKILNREIREKDEIINMFQKAGDWLLMHNEEVSNQQAGAVAALYNIYEITTEEKYKESAEKKLEHLKKRQSKEGWLPEYGGPDIGYLTIVLDFLGKYYKESHDKKVLDLVNPCLDFLKYFIHPDGSLGGVYSSRNTEFSLPHGLEIFSSINKNARYIADKIAENITNTLNPMMMDDRYAFQYHISFLQAFLDYKSRERAVLRFSGKKFFRDCGLFVYNKNYYLVVNVKKGGVFRIFKGKKHICDDHGVVARIGDKIVVSQWNNSSAYDLKNDSITVTGKLRELYPRQKLSSSKNMLFKMFLLTLGRNTSIALSLKEYLRKKLVLRAKETDITYKRSIELDKDKVVVIDKLENFEDIKIDALYIPSKFQSAYVPTSSFFQYIDPLGGSERDYTGDLIKYSNIKREIIV